MSKDITITINAQDFAELYQEFLQNNLKIATEHNHPDDVVASHYLAYIDFESMDDSIEQGIIHMQNYALEQLKKEIKKQGFVLKNVKPTDGNQ